MKFERLFTRKNREQYIAYVGPLCTTEQVLRLRQYPHHGTVSRYDHVLLVSYLSFALAKRWGWDAQAAARAGLLHDLFWTECDGAVRLCFRHPEMAAENAEQLLGDLTPKERNIILSHMWPAGRHLPRSREAWLVDAVDDFVAVLDYTRRSARWNRLVGDFVAI